MARLRSDSAKPKKETTRKTSTASRVCKNDKSSATVAKNPISSKVRVQSVKREIEPPADSLQKSTKSSGKATNEALKNGPPRHGKRRKFSSQELSESPSKKPKVNLAEDQMPENVKNADEEKSCSKAEKQKSLSSLKQSSKKNEVKPKATSIVLNQAHVSLANIKGKLKKESPVKQKHLPVPTPEDEQRSPRKHAVVSKRLKPDLKAIVKEENVVDEIKADECEADDSSDDEEVQWEDVDEVDVVDHGPEDQEASTSQEHQPANKSSVEISITVPGTKKRKKGWSHEDVVKYIKRAINRFRKDVYTSAHKVHILTLIANGFFRNNICNEPLLQAVLLSHVPSDFISLNKRKWDVVQLTNFLKWFQSEFSSTDDVRTGNKEADKQIARFQNLSEVFGTILRALGFLTRLVYSLQPMSAKGDTDVKTSSKTSKKNTHKGNKVSPHNSSKAILKKLSVPNKQEEAAMNSRNTKSENKSKTTLSKSLALISENRSEISSEKLKKEKVAKSCKKEGGESSYGGKRTPKTSNETSKVHKNMKKGKGNISDKPVKKLVKKRPLRKRAKIDYSLSDHEIESSGDKEWNVPSSDSEEEEEDRNCMEKSSTKKNKTPLVRKKVSSSDSCNDTPTENSSVSFVDLLDDDSDFEVSSKPLVKRKLAAGSSDKKKKALKIISSDDSDDEGVNWWTEVFLPSDKKWICVHLESSSVNHPEMCEQQAAQPMVYVVSFDNDNAVKDVTNRYASSFMSKTRKLRIDFDWWEDTLLPYKSKNKKMDKMEDSHLEDQLLDKPLPTSITEYKNHPLYVLKRHLLKFEGLYPETAAILGYCRGEAVYSRECVHLLHTREKWLNEALVVKQGEKPYKVVKGRPKRNQPIHERDSVTIDLFGRWQTEKYKPPPAKDGKVPRNEYGNVELFQPCMLPPGTKHIQINGIQRVAKKLGIDCAQAVIGFDFHCGFSHPVIDGVVVCEEYEQTLLDAWHEEEQQAEKKKAEKREKRMLANWKLLTRSLLIRERLKKRYDTEDTSKIETPSTSQGDEVVTDASVSWPLNRQGGKTSVAGEGHCHVFPESGHSQDPVTGEWRKSCSCGLTLPFEKM